MAKIEFKLNPAGVRQLLQSAEMQKIIGEKCDTVQNAAGSGYESEVTVKETRVLGIVRADTAEAYHENLEQNKLLKALGSARG